MRVSQAVLGFDDLDSLKGTGQVSRRTPLSWNLPDVFLMIRTYGLGEETPGVEHPCHHVVSRFILSQGSSQMALTSVTWLRG